MAAVLTPKDKVKCIPGSGKHITMHFGHKGVQLTGAVQLTEQTTEGSLPTARKRKEKGVQAANLGDSRRLFNSQLWSSRPQGNAWDQYQKSFTRSWQP